MPNDIELERIPLKSPEDNSDDESEDEGDRALLGSPRIRQQEPVKLWPQIKNIVTEASRLTVANAIDPAEFVLRLHRHYYLLPLAFCLPANSWTMSLYVSSCLDTFIELTYVSAGERWYKLTSS